MFKTLIILRNKLIHIDPTLALQIHKLAGQFQGQCTIYNISESEDFTEYPNYRDYYDILNDVENIFKNSGIRIAHNEEFFEACIDDEGVVHGASVIGNTFDSNHEYPIIRFSVAVDTTKRNSGVARALIQSVIQSFSDENIIEAYVVNPHMVSLLESLGFEGEWSEHNPIMTLYPTF